MTMLNTGLITLGSFTLTTLIVTYAFSLKKQFYPSVVYITKSSPAMAVLYLQALVLLLLFTKTIVKIFFGQLRPAEMEHLIERFWYAITETCLAFTVFRDDFSPRFVAMFTFLLVLKCFHWLTDDRIDYMERSPIISVLFHLRAIGFILILAILDIVLVNHAYYSTLTRGATVQLVFGFEYAILFTSVVTLAVKYILHSIDLRSETPWEMKNVILLYFEIVINAIRVLLYSVFFLLMVKLHTFPLFAIRPMYLTIRALKKALHDVIMSRRAIRNMNNLYPDATPEELQNSDVCIICREDMTSPGAGAGPIVPGIMSSVSKKLPCGHIFHKGCLRSWFQRQQTCPTCRMDVLRTPVANATVQQQNVSSATSSATTTTTTATSSGTSSTNAFTMPPNGMPSLPNMPQFPPIPPFFAPPPFSVATFDAGPSGTNETATQSSMHGNFMIPPPPMIPPLFSSAFPIPFPPPPSDFKELSDDELRVMEGNEREAIEARIECLRNIQVLLDAAVCQMQQYHQVISKLPLPKSEDRGKQPIGSISKMDAIRKEKDKEAEIKFNLSDVNGEEDSDEEEKNKVRQRRLEKFNSSTDVKISKDDD